MTAVAVQVAAAVVTGCAVNITLLPTGTGAAALDGTPYGFFFVKAASPSERRWTISIEGGGWCVGEADCFSRSQETTHDGQPGSLGSSTPLIGHPKGCGCMNTDGDNLASDCNCIYMPYLDGGSFSGNLDRPLPVSGHPGKFLHYRGLRNLDATLEYAFENLGLADATEMVVTGGSAGGLSTFLHSDRIAAVMRERAPGCRRTTAVPVVGYFLDHANYAQEHGGNGGNSAAGASSGASHGALGYPHRGNYSSWMEIVVRDQNATGALLPKCLEAHASNPHLCFMSPHMAEFVETPFFVLNSRFDAWQMNNDLQVPCGAGEPKHTRCNATEQQAIVQYGADFLTALKPAVASAPKNGAFITSCVCHGCDWASLALDNATAYTHYARWHRGAAGADAVHVDERPPNGGGDIKLSTCMPFP